MELFIRIPAEEDIWMPLGAGAQYGVLPPFSRKHETEADQIGLTDMARAGYDPRESVIFRKRMMAASQGAKPSELMPTHPVLPLLTADHFRRCNRQHAHNHRVAHCLNEPGLFFDRLLQRLRFLIARVVH